MSEMNFRSDDEDDYEGDDPIARPPGSVVPGAMPPPPRLHTTSPAMASLQSAPPSGNISALPPPPTMTLPPPPNMKSMTDTTTTLPPPPTMSAVAATGSALTETTSTTTTDTDATDSVPQPPPLSITTFQSQYIFLAKRQSHLPILVIATEKANRLAWKNKLQLCDLFQGLAEDLTSVTTSGQPLAPFRSATKTLHLQWKDLGLRFLSNTTAKELTAAETQALLQQHAALQPSDGDLTQELDLLEEQVDVLLHESDGDSSNDPTVLLIDEHAQHTKRVERVVKDAFSLTSPPTIPWLQRFRVALDESTNFLQHDLTDQPLMALLLCASDEPYAECFADLANHYNLPPLYHEKVYDATNLKKEVIVLHDAVDGPKDLNLDQLQRSLKTQYGPTAALLSINSIVPSMAVALEEEETQDIWNGGGKKGNCLSVSDRLVIRRYVAQLISNSILPNMERRISDLNHIVTERKKGVRNVFRGLFRPNRTAGTGVKDMEDRTLTESGSYRYDSVESQVRHLGDMLFLVKDYDTALSMYKLIRDDYKNDGATLHYASVQEMSALATYMMDPVGRSKEVFSYLETALFNYTRAAEEERDTAGPSTRPSVAPKPTRLATRLCLVLASAKNIETSERHLEVADLLASASSHETSLGSAVLLEQSSAHYYKAGMYRKYAFHMLMAGHMFRSAHQEHHAFRCFTSALYIYQDGQWDELHNHLRSALAAQLYSLGRMAISVELYAKLVGTTAGGKVSVKSQQKFVNHLLEICKDHAKKALVGADRMAAPPSGKIRRERYARIDNVIARTKNAKRVLEIPNIDLPAVDDASVTMQVEAEIKDCDRVVPSLGKTAKGDDAVWDELEGHTIAELRAFDPNTKVNEEEMSSALMAIADPDIRRVLKEIDREKTNANLLARAKRSGSFKPHPKVRAKMEPLVVEFVMTNPLSVRVETQEMQLVARMTEKPSGRVCTNEDGIEIGVATPTKTWSFTSSENSFGVPDFCRLSSVDGSKSWISTELNDPSFVVNKIDRNMEPGGKTSICLSICPLAVGDLEVLGVRYKLFDGVWAYHPFNIQGALLQNTQENRANRARAEPMLLKAKIEDDMPRLTAQLLPSGTEPHEPVIQGEISSWTLRLRNIGTAAACNVSLKTNVPWVNVHSAGRQGENPEAARTSRCIGSSATLLALPLEGPGLASTGTIQPGEAVDIPMDIRTFCESPQQDFYMLFRYELPGASPGKGFRWLRQMVAATIYPSVTVTAALMPSYWAKREHVVSIEMANYKSEPIYMDKLSIVSREYRLDQIGGQIEDSASDVITLDIHERATMHYRLVPLTASRDTCVVTDCKFTEAGGESCRQECVVTDSVDHLCLEASHSRFHACLRKYDADMARADAEEEDQQPRHVSQIRRAKTGAAEKSFLAEGYHPTSIARVFPLGSSKTKVDLICSWRTQESKNCVSGQHHIQGVDVRSKTKSRGCPLTVTCKYASSVQHDFASGPAQVPFEVTVRNRLVEAPVDFIFSLERPKTFEFVGSECFTWTLEGGDELTVPVTAVIPTAGIYNIQKVRLTIKKQDKDIPYLFPLQWMVRVDNSK